MSATLRSHLSQRRIQHRILMFTTLCALILVAVLIQPASADWTPTLEFSTYLGGLNPENAADVQVDAQHGAAQVLVVRSMPRRLVVDAGNPPRDRRAKAIDLLIARGRVDGDVDRQQPAAFERLK